MPQVPVKSHPIKVLWVFHLGRRLSRAAGAAGLAGRLGVPVTAGGAAARMLNPHRPPTGLLPLTEPVL